jgi:hypothetical protein
MLQDSIAPVGPGDRYAGFRKLWFRVIQRAIYDWVAWRDSSKLDKRKQAELAEVWLFKPSVLFNSFENICQILDVDPEAIRSRARAFTKEEVLKAEHIERSGRRLDSLLLPIQEDEWAQKRAAKGEVRLLAAGGG